MSLLGVTPFERSMFGYDLRPGSGDPLDDEFDGSALNTTKWTWLDQGDTTATLVDGRLRFRLREDANRTRGIYQSAPSGSWAVEAKVYAPTISAGDRSMTGIFAAENATGDVRSIGIWNTQNVRGLQFPTPSSNGAAWGTSYTMYRHWYYFQLSWNGTTLSGSHSADGRQWVTISTVNPAYTPSLVGINITNNRNILGMFDVGWFRRTA